MIHFNYNLKLTLLAVLIILLSSCSEDNDSVFYKIDPDVIPAITDTVVAKSRVINGRLSYMNQASIVKRPWALGEGTIYAVMDSTGEITPIDRDFDISSVYVLAESDFDSYGQFKLTLPNFLPPEFVEYASEMYEDFDVESKKLLTNKYTLRFIVKYETTAWGIISDSYSYMDIYRDDKETSSEKAYEYTYNFFDEKSSITGKSEDGKTCNIYTDKGWTIIEKRLGNYEWYVHVPVDAYYFVLAF